MPLSGPRCLAPAPTGEDGRVIDEWSVVVINPNDPEADSGVPGIDDSTQPGTGVVRDPLWIILGHELCGHAAPNQSHPPAPTGYTSTDPIIVIENAIRAEHSTADNNFGRRGDDLPATIGK